jgi:tRNA pseudouridine38-40 synthase
MVKYLGVVSYLGTRYKGFERQKNYETIQGHLESALAYFLGQETLIHGAGRTDAGVHARGQTFSFESPHPLEEKEALHALNRLLPSDIVVKSLSEVPSSFDARHSSEGKVYSYSFHYGERDPFALMEFQLEWPHFDLGLYQACLKLYEGQHNFEDFTTKPTDKDGFVRTIDSIQFVDGGNSHYITTFTGNGFMTYMVRILVGVAFKVAMAKMSLDEVKELLTPTERNIISYKAPAEGLCLERVIYG